MSSRTDKGVFTANTLMRHFDMHGFALISFQNHLHTYKTKIIASQSLYTLLMIRIGTCCRYYIEFLTETFFIRLELSTVNFRSQQQTISIIVVVEISQESWHDDDDVTHEKENK